MEQWQTLIQWAVLVPVLVILVIDMALGLRGLRQALRGTEQAPEMAGLNQQLKAHQATLLCREQELTRQRDFLDTMFENIAPDFVLVLDGTGHIQRGNDAFFEQTGWSRQQIIGSTGHFLIPTSVERQHFSKEIFPHLRLSGKFRLEHEILTCDGRHLPIESCFTYVTTQDVYIVVSRDVGQRRLHESQLQAALAFSEHDRAALAILRAVTHACATAITEEAVATDGLSAIARQLQSQLAFIAVRDGQRPAFLRIVGQYVGTPQPLKKVQRLMQELLAAPLTEHVESPLLSPLVTGQAIYGAAAQREDEDVITALPLFFEGRPFGVMAFIHTEQTDVAPDEFLLQAAAEEIATALHRARLYEDARRFAHYDPLTGLRNHRAAQDLLQQEVASCTTTGLPLSVIELDLDHFRQFNQTYGHQVGDRALRSVAALLQRLVRTGEYPARFGGEEFLVVLPNANTQRAAELAQQIMLECAQTVIALDDAEEQGAEISVSIGYATFPLHASAAASLLKAADLALYSAKRAGRNMAVGYSANLLEETMPLASAFHADEEGELTLPTGSELEALQALIAAIDLRDGYTAAHSDGVSRYAVAIARALHLPAEQVDALRLGGFIHDVGKIGVPDHILRKPGRLTDEEWVPMKAHTTMGEAIAGRVEHLRHLLPLVRWHHERLDGSGYPDGLRDEQIPPLVRILSVADVFEAFTAERPYHPGRPAIEGLRLLREEAQRGKLDASFVEMFATILYEQGLVTEGNVGEEDLLHAA